MQHIYDDCFDEMQNYDTECCNSCCEGPRGPRGFRGERGGTGPTGNTGANGLVGPTGATAPYIYAKSYIRKNYAL